VALFVNPLSALSMVHRCQALKADAVVITAAASQLGRMLIKLLTSKGIKPVCVVRRQEQVDLLKNEYGAQHVFLSTSDDYKKQMAETCKELNAKVCLECIAGDVPAEMLEFMGFGSTCIVYGALSEKPMGNLNPLGFIGAGKTLESFMMPIYMAQKLTPAEIGEFYKQSELLCTSTFKTEVNKRFGFHQWKEAMQFYYENQTAGKVLFRADLTE